MAAVADYRPPLSPVPGNTEPTSCSSYAFHCSPESAFDIGSFEDRETAAITSPTACSFDISAAIVVSGPLARATEPLSTPLNTRLALLGDFDAMAVESFDKTIALVDKCEIRPEPTSTLKR